MIAFSEYEKAKKKLNFGKLIFCYISRPAYKLNSRIISCFYWSLRTYNY